MVICGMHGGVDDAVAFNPKWLAVLFCIMDIPRKTTCDVVKGCNPTVDDGIVIQEDMLSVAYYAAHVGALSVDAGLAVDDTTVADGGIVIGVATPCLFCIGAEDAAVFAVGAGQIVVDECQVADFPSLDVGKQCTVAVKGYGMAVAYDVALPIEGGILDIVVVAVQYGEILVVKVDVAFQIDIARVKVAPVAVVVHVVDIACQLGGIMDVDALLQTVGTQFIVLERLPVPQAVAVVGEIGAVLSKTSVLAPVAHVSLIVGIRCVYTNDCHQYSDEPNVSSF